MRFINHHGIALRTAYGAIELPVPDGTHTSDLAKVIVELLNWVQTSSFAEVWDGNNWVGKMAEEDSYKQEILNLAS